MEVFRIAKSKNASDISGTGAALFPGRWNKRGTQVLYTGETKDIALLENLVHIPPMVSPRLDMLTLWIPDNSMTIINVADLPLNWYQFPAPTILSEIGQNWVDEGTTIALKVPSCIIHSSHNIILNCNHKEYKSVKIIDQKEFYFDTRLRNF